MAKSIDSEHILEFFQNKPERPWHVQDIQKDLQIDDRGQLMNALNELVQSGQLVKTRRRSFGLPKEMNLLKGRLQVTSGGYGFVILEQGGQDLFVPADKLAGAWEGDIVMVRPGKSKDDSRPSGEIVRIVSRGSQEVVGTLEYARGYAILRPDSVRLPSRILLTPESVGRLEGGSRILVKMVFPETSGEREAFGEVSEFLGMSDDPGVETRAVIAKYGLKAEFDPDTIAEAQAVPATVTSEFMGGRTDYRKITTMTIDGADAKDFDDALSLERVKGKKKNEVLYRIGVHIADVSYYVAEGTSLDKEAEQRGNSVYLPGKTLPMLPEELSNGICSLQEGESRLALSVMFDMNRQGEVLGFKIRETVIESNARLTYPEVQEFIDGGRLPVGKRKLERDIKVMHTIAQELRKQRIKAGALDFEFTETKVELGEDGEPEVVPVKSNEAHQLIEEFMLLANRTVAAELMRRKMPGIFRVHEAPNADKLETLQKALHRLGHKVALSEEPEPRELQEIMKLVAGKPEAELVNTLLLRSLKQARYSAEDYGHYGLAFEHYLHFTSPIRRYPDLVVHRVVRAMLQHRLSPTLKERMKTDFPRLAEETSVRERQAEEAERDLTRYYHARWAREHIGKKFTGYVNGVTGFGVFVQLENGVEGLLHVSQLTDDYYVYMEDQLMLLGKHTRKRYRFGDRIEVKIYTVNPTQRQIDLLPASADVPEPEPEAPKQVKPPKVIKEPFPETPAAAKPTPAAKPAPVAKPAPAKAAPAKAAPAKPAPDKKPVPSAKPPKKRRYRLRFGPKE